MGDRMIKKRIKIKNKHGLHLRPATELIKLTSTFDGDILIEKDSIEVNGKSILGILTLGIERDQVITIKLDGEGEEEFIKKLEEFFQREE